MSNEVLMYILIGVVALFAVIVIAYLMLAKRMKHSDIQQIKELRQGTERNSFSSEIMYQKLYIAYIKIPLLKRYLLKLRRRLEIINIDDEYLTRSQASKILTKAVIIMLFLTVGIFMFASNNTLLLAILLIFELFIADTIIDGMVDKIDNNLLKQQINFFSEIRHAYHEFNMVEEAIYQTAQDDELEISRQANKIYEILTKQLLNIL